MFQSAFVAAEADQDRIVHPERRDWEGAGDRAEILLGPDITGPDSPDEAYRSQVDTESDRFVAPVYNIHRLTTTRHGLHSQTRIKARRATSRIKSATTTSPASQAKVARSKQTQKTLQNEKPRKTKKERDAIDRAMGASVRGGKGGTSTAIIRVTTAV